LVGWQEVLQHAGAAGGGNTLGADEVLDGGGNAGKRGGIASGDAFVGFLRLLQGQLFGDGDVGSDVVLDLVDAVEDGLGELAGGQLAACEAVGCFVDGEVVEFQRWPPKRLLQDRPHAEEAALGLGGVGEDVLGRVGGSRFVIAHHVLQGDGVGSGRDALGVYLLEDLEVVDDLRELLLELGDLFVAHGHAEEHGDVSDFVTGNGHGCHSCLIKVALL
jgi:hypothetical protein